MAPAKAPVKAAAAASAAAASSGAALFYIVLAFLALSLVAYYLLTEKKAGKKHLGSETLRTEDGTVVRRSARCAPSFAAPGPGAPQQPWARITFGSPPAQLERPQPGPPLYVSLYHRTRGASSTRPAPSPQRRHPCGDRQPPARRRVAAEDEGGQGDFLMSPAPPPAASPSDGSAPPGVVCGRPRRLIRLLGAA